MQALPRVNLVVLRARNIERIGEFYGALGMKFVAHRHGNGPEHLCASSGDAAFEIYPALSEQDTTVNTRLGLSVASMANALKAIRRFESAIVSPPKSSPWGLRAVVLDPEGHKVELTEAACQRTE